MLGGLSATIDKNIHNPFIMLQLLLASIGFVPWVIYIVLTYYSTTFSKIDHIESVTGYGGYLIGLGFVYLLYKIASMMLNERKVGFSFWHIS